MVFVNIFSNLCRYRELLKLRLLILNFLFVFLSSQHFAITTSTFAFLRRKTKFISLDTQEKQNFQTFILHHVCSSSYDFFDHWSVDFFCALFLRWTHNAAANATEKLINIPMHTPVNQAGFCPIFVCIGFYIKISPPIK